MLFLVASSGEVAELQPAKYPTLYKRVPTVADKCHNNAKKPCLEPLFWFVHSGLL